MNHSLLFKNRYYLWLFTVLLFQFNLFAVGNNCIKDFEKYEQIYNENYNTHHLKTIEAAHNQLEIAKSCDNDSLFIHANINLGWVYLVISDYSSALTHTQQAYLLSEKLDYQDFLFSALNLKGVIFLELDDLEYALKYYSEGMQLAEEINDSTQMSVFYNNVALVYDYKKDFDNALKFYLKSLLIHKRLGYEEDVALSYMNIGDLYTQYHMYHLSERYQMMALEMMRKEGNGYYLFNLYAGIAERESKQNNHKKALTYLDSAVVSSDYEPGKADYADFYDLKSEILFRMHDYKSAYEYSRKMIDTKDSILNNEVMSELKELQISSVQKQADAQMESLKKDNKIKDLEIEKSKATQKNYLLIVVIVTVALAFTFFLFVTLRKNALRLKKRNQIIERQSEEIQFKNEQLQVFNDEMMDSIHYAKKLQEAIMPNELLLQSLFSYGKIFLPKDVVSGDFYWLAQNNEQKQTYFAVADCTGHGVPGAMVSVVCANALNKAVYDEPLKSTGEILDKTRFLVEKTFTSSHQLKDGMDVSLIAINPLNKSDEHPLEWSLTFSGANNPLWISRSVSKGNQIVVLDQNGEEEKIDPIAENDSHFLFEIKPDKQPVGAYINSKSFGSKILNVAADDTLFLFTDGVYDQFGNKEAKAGGKKLKKSRLKKLLIQNTHLSVSQQMNELNNFLLDWKKGLEQIDDICIFAIQLDKNTEL